MLNIKDALYSGIHTVQENAKKINETVAPGIVHGIETAATKTGDALTAGKNTVVNTGAAAKDAVMDQLDEKYSSTEEYVKVLKEINGLSSDKIYSGENLMIMYMTE